MNILHIDCSPREESWSRKLSAVVVSELRTVYRDLTIVSRDLGFDPVGHPSSAYATALTNRDAYQAALETDALDQSERLILEVEASDIIVIGTPMNNYTVPSSLKAWLDNIIRAGRTLGVGPEGKFGLLPDRPVYLAIASGDIFDGPGANQPDHLTPYLRLALGSIGLTTLSIFAIQSTARTEEGALYERLSQLQAVIRRTAGDMPLQRIATV